jgi:NAD(P)-dependent dehydrogenase (short-subunit alcohol dehydrogenase family)
MGEIDVLVADRRPHPGTALLKSPGRWDETMDVKPPRLFFVMQQGGGAVHEGRGGSIVNFASMAASAA